MRIAKAISLTDEQRARLTKWSRGRGTPARLVQRAKIVLAAAEGRQNRDIAAELGWTRRTVGTWRNRFAESGLKNAPRPGRAASVRAAKEAEIIRQTTQETPPSGACEPWPQQSASSRIRGLYVAANRRRTGFSDTAAFLASLQPLPPA